MSELLFMVPTEKNIFLKSSAFDKEYTLRNTVNVISRFYIPLTYIEMILLIFMGDRTCVNKVTISNQCRLTWSNFSYRICYCDSNRTTTYYISIRRDYLCDLTIAICCDATTESSTTIHLFASFYCCTGAILNFKYCRCLSWERRVSGDFATVSIFKRGMYKKITFFRMLGITELNSLQIMAQHQWCLYQITVIR